MSNNFKELLSTECPELTTVYNVWQVFTILCSNSTSDSVVELFVAVITMYFIYLELLGMLRFFLSLEYMN